MTTHTNNTSVLASYIKNLLLTNMQLLGLKDVLYGNQLMLPRSPVAVITPGPKRRELAGVSAPGGRTMNYLTVNIDVYSSKIGNEEDERLALDQLSEQVEFVLHHDVQMGGNIIHGFVTDWTPGETTLQGNSQFRWVRLSFVGLTKTYLSA